MIRKKEKAIEYIVLISEDRFWEPVEDLLIGTASVFPQCLAYRLDFDDEICIMDYKVSLVLFAVRLKLFIGIFRVLNKVV